jgi:hypothetical protein
LHHAVIEVNGLAFGGLFLKTLNRKIQRDTIVIPQPHADGLVAQLSSEIKRRINEFNRLACKSQAEWGIGKTATLKKIERLALEKSFSNTFNLRTVAHHFGAVPTIPIGEIQSGARKYHITILPSLADLPNINPLEDKEELLLSFERYLPHLLTSYFEQIGYYLRAIFFGADDSHVIKFAHRIRNIAKASIRGKITEIRNEHTGMNRLISEGLRKTHGRDIQIAEAIDAVAHLITNHIYSFYCIESKSHIARYEERLSKIVIAENVMGEEHPVSFLRECIRHINTPENNDVFISRINNLKPTDWLVPLGEAAAYIGEIKRSCKKGFSAPNIFVGYHFEIEANDKAFEQLSAAIEAHWPKVHLLQGRHLDRNIRWSLLGKIWFADAYLFLIPPAFITRDGTHKRLDQKEDWLLLEFTYTVLIGKHILTMKPKRFDAAVFEKFKTHLESYAPKHEITQISKSRWEANVVKTKKSWHQVMRDLERLPSMNSLEVNSLASFENAILSPLHKKLIDLFFQAAFWYLDSDALLLLQILLKQFPEGRGMIERKELRKKFNSLSSKHTFSEAVNNLLLFNLDIFEKLEPLVVENDNEFTLRLADVIDVLCKNFCCHPPHIVEHIISQMLSTRRED